MNQFHINRFPKNNSPVEQASSLFLCRLEARTTNIWVIIKLEVPNSKVGWVEVQGTICGLTKIFMHCNPTGIKLLNESISSRSFCWVTTGLVDSTYSNQFVRPVTEVSFLAR